MKRDNQSNLLDEETQATKRRRQRRKDARPSEIIDAGLQEFAEFGFSGAKLENVAARAGVVKGTIYRYFDSKEALFEAALLSRGDAIFQSVDSLIDSFPGTSVELLKSALSTIYHEMFRSDLFILMRIIITEGSRFPSISEVYYRQSVSKGREFLARIIERGINRGEFRRSAATSVPMVLAGPAVMAAVWRMTFDRFDPISLEEFQEAHIELILNGLVAKSDEG